MPLHLKRYVFFGLLLGILAALLLGRPLMAAAVAGALFGWLAVETRERQAFAFVANRACPEKRAQLDGPVQALAVSQAAPWALLVGPGQVFSLLGLDGMRVHWTRHLAALAVTVRPDGQVLWASEDRLHLCDASGEVTRTLGFEAPLFRQSYRLLLSADGRKAVLHTPWFIQAFEPDLSALGPRLRYEDAGHYMKYAVLSPDASRLYTAGALLLEEDEGSSAGMEARWDAWDWGAHAFNNAWKEAYQSYNNSHLRGLGLSADGRVLSAELWQEGYEFRLFDAQGALLWKRAGEHPVLSPDGSLLLWESRFDGVVLSRVADQGKLFSRKFDEQIRHKAVGADGSCFLVVGARLFVLGPDGTERWSGFFKHDPEHLGAGPAGALLVAEGARAGLLKAPWQG